MPCRLGGSSPPSSCPHLSRRSGSIPGEPYPPLRHDQHSVSLCLDDFAWKSDALGRSITQRRRPGAITASPKKSLSQSGGKNSCPQREKILDPDQVGARRSSGLGALTVGRKSRKCTGATFPRGLFGSAGKVCRSHFCPPTFSARSKVHGSHFSPRTFLGQPEKCIGVTPIFLGPGRK